MATFTLPEASTDTGYGDGFQPEVDERQIEMRLPLPPDPRQVAMSFGFGLMCDCGKPAHVKHCCPFSIHGECGN